MNSFSRPLSHTRHCRSLLTPAAFAVLLALSPEAWAAAGKVLFATGSVQLNRNGSELSALTRGSELNAGDLIITGSTGFTQLLMEDGGRLTLRANSQLRLDQFVYDGKPGKQNQSLMSLLTGSMRAITGLIGHQNRDSYKIKTPTATVGIRGSDGNVGYDPAIGASVQTLEGGHTLSSIDARGVAHTLSLNPGETGLVPPGGLPLKVSSFPFATTLAPQARARPTLADTPSNGSGETGTASTETTSSTGETGSGTAETDIRTDVAAAGTSGPAANGDGALLDTAGSGLITLASTDAPALIDGEGGLPATGPGGDPIVIIPIVIPPDGGTEQPPLGHSPKLTSVVGVTTWNSFDGFSYGRSEVDSQMLLAEQLSFDAAGNLTGYRDDDSGSDSALHQISNGIAGPQQSSGAITLGSWGSNAQTEARFIESRTLDNSGSNLNWAWATAGYYALDPQNPGSFPLTGQMSYHAVHVGGRAWDGSNVSLNGATLNANFTNQTASLTLDLMAGSNQWLASSTDMSLSNVGNQAYHNTFSANTFDGSLSVSSSAQVDAATEGSISGSFTGANFSGALVQYGFAQPGADSGVSGAVAFKADGTVSGPAAGSAPVDNPVVAVSAISHGGGGNGLQVSGLDGSNVTGWTWASVGRQEFSLKLEGGSSTETSILGTGIHLGQWQGGQIVEQTTTFLDSNGSWQWGTLERPQAWYLPALLSGSASYTTTAASTTRASDGSLWTLNDAQTLVQVDFTNQLVDATVTLTRSDGVVVEASTNDAMLHAADGQFAASTYGRGGDQGDGTLIIKRDGVMLTEAEGNGRLAGQLGGAGLSDALLGYGLTIFEPCLQRVDCSDGFVALGGLAALSGPSHNENQSFTQTDVAMLGSDGAGLSALGFSSGSHYSTDSAGVSSFNAWPDFKEAVHLHRGTATVLDSGSDTVSGMSWGRWSGDAAVQDASGNVIGSASNVHYVNSQETGPALLPLSGSYSYTPVGHTTPTNQNGDTGVLDNATLTANFTTRMVDVDVQATVAGTSLSGSGHNVALFDNAFHASSDGGGTGVLTVTCSGSCGPINAGSITGHFSGNGAVGAGLSYSLGNGNAASTPTLINGVVAFKRGP